MLRMTLLFDSRFFDTAFSYDLILKNNIMSHKNIVRFEPYYNSWIIMDDEAEVYEVELSKDFNPQDYPEYNFITPGYKIENACSVPIFVQILLTESCNYRCPKCPVVISPRKIDELSISEIINLIDYCAEKGVMCIRLSGGEATRHKYFSEIVDYIRQRGMKCSLLSNCKIINDDIKDALSKMCYIQTHLDSADKDVFNYLTGGDNFDSFLNSLEYLKSQKVQVNAAATLQKENLEGFKEIIDLCSKYHLTLRIGACYNDGKSNTLHMWYDYYNSIVKPFAKEWPKLKAYAKDLGTTVYCFLDKELVDGSVEDPMSVISPWGRSYIVIDSEGSIYPYSLLLNQDCKLGNIRKDDLIDVWKNAELLKRLRSINKKSIGCKDCRVDCVYANTFFSYSYLGDFGGVLPHSDCSIRNFKI